MRDFIFLMLCCILKQNVTGATLNSQVVYWFPISVQIDIGTFVQYEIDHE